MEKLNKKIAIMSEEENIDNALVSDIFGRASYIHLFNDGELIKTIKNPFKFGGGGAGTGVSQLLINENVNLVIAGNFGEKIKNILDNNGIVFEEKKGVRIKDLI